MEAQNENNMTKHEWEDMLKELKKHLDEKPRLNKAYIIDFINFMEDSINKKYMAQYRIIKNRILESSVAAGDNPKYATLKICTAPRM